MIRYAVRYYQEDEWYMAEIPTLDIVTQGESPEEIRHMAQDAVSGVLRAMIWTLGQDLPANDDALPRGKEWSWVYPYPKTTTAIEIRELRRMAGLSMSQAAERIGVSKGVYQRWEHPEQCNARVETLEKIGAAFGQQVTISFLEAS